MVYKVFSLFDSAVEAYNVPMFLRSRGEAIRALQSAVNDPQSSICKWPDQYVLFEIGTYDDSNGVVTMHKAPQSLGAAVQYKDSPKADTPLEEAIRNVKMVSKGD